jgi:hypothetical protein
VEEAGRGFNVNIKDEMLFLDEDKEEKNQEPRNKSQEPK